MFLFVAKKYFVFVLLIIVPFCETFSDSQESELVISAVTVNQYCDFLKENSSIDQYYFYHPRIGLEDMQGTIIQEGTPGHYSYRVLSDFSDKAVNYVNGIAQKAFCDWVSEKARRYYGDKNKVCFLWNPKGFTRDVLLQSNQDAFSIVAPVEVLHPSTCVPFQENTNTGNEYFKSIRNIAGAMVLITAESRKGDGEEHIMPEEESVSSLGVSTIIESHQKLLGDVCPQEIKEAYQNAFVHFQEAQLRYHQLIAVSTALENIQSVHQVEACNAQVFYQETAHAFVNYSSMLHHAIEASGYGADSEYIGMVLKRAEEWRLCLQVYEFNKMENEKRLIHLQHIHENVASHFSSSNPEDIEKEIDISFQSLLKAEEDLKKALVDLQSYEKRTISHSPELSQETTPESGCSEQALITLLPSNGSEELHQDARQETRLVSEEDLLEIYRAASRRINKRLQNKAQGGVKIDNPYDGLQSADSSEDESPVLETEEVPVSLIPKAEPSSPVATSAMQQISEISPSHISFWEQYRASIHKKVTEVRSVIGRTLYDSWSLGCGYVTQFMNAMNYLQELGASSETVTQRADTLHASWEAGAKREAEEAEKQKRAEALQQQEARAFAIAQQLITQEEKERSAELEKRSRNKKKKLKNLTKTSRRQPKQDRQVEGWRLVDELLAQREGAVLHAECSPVVDLEERSTKELPSSNFSQEEKTESWVSSFLESTRDLYLFFREIWEEEQKDKIIWEEILREEEEEKNLVLQQKKEKEKREADIREQLAEKLIPKMKARIDAVEECQRAGKNFSSIPDTIPPLSQEELKFLEDYNKRVFLKEIQKEWWFRIAHFFGLISKEENL